MLTFDGSNRITNPGYVYDAAGNLLMDNFHCYTYDAENRLVSTVPETLGGVCGSTTDPNAMNYLYDPDGRRVARLQNGSIVKQYYYDAAGHMITEADASGNTLRAEIYAGGRHLATWINSGGGATFFNHADWLGTERVRTFGSGSQAGQPCETITSLPFGDGQATQQLNGGCGDPSPNHFTGLERDSESGLDHTLYRQYASNYGRWLSPDPAGIKAVKLGDPQTWNLYDYVRNNPPTLTDPLGLYTWARECGAHDEKCDAQRQAFRDSLTELALARNHFKPDSKEYRRIDRVLKAYGEEGKGGPKVAFGKVEGGGGEYNPKTNTVKLDTSGLSEAQLATRSGHEGEHYADRGLQMHAFQREFRAFDLASRVAEGLGLSKREAANAGTIWDPSWGEFRDVDLGQGFIATWETIYAGKKEYNQDPAIQLPFDPFPDK